MGDVPAVSPVMLLEARAPTGLFKGLRVLLSLSCSMAVSFMTELTLMYSPLFPWRLLIHSRASSLLEAARRCIWPLTLGGGTIATQLT